MWLFVIVALLSRDVPSPEAVAVSFNEQALAAYSTQTIKWLVKPGFFKYLGYGLLLRYFITEPYFSSEHWKQLNQIELNLGFLHHAEDILGAVTGTIISAWFIYATQWWKVEDEYTRRSA